MRAHGTHTRWPSPWRRSVTHPAGQLGLTRKAVSARGRVRGRWPLASGGARTSLRPKQRRRGRSPGPLACRACCGPTQALTYRSRPRTAQIRGLSGDAKPRSPTRRCHPVKWTLISLQAPESRPPLVSPLARQTGLGDSQLAAFVPEKPINETCRSSGNGKPIQRMPLAMATPTAMRTRPPRSSPRSPSWVPSRSPSSSPAKDKVTLTAPMTIAATAKLTW